MKKQLLALALLTLASAGFAEFDYFAALDQNGDGKVTVEEWITKNKATQLRQGKDFDEAKSRSYFDARDLNKDGVLTREEVQ
jgi:Ca2+-binding EF-hand superfamily protein